MITEAEVIECVRRVRSKGSLASYCFHCNGEKFSKSVRMMQSTDRKNACPMLTFTCKDCGFSTLFSVSVIAPDVLDAMRKRAEQARKMRR